MQHPLVIVALSEELVRIQNRNRYDDRHRGTEIEEAERPPARPGFFARLAGLLRNRNRR